MPVVLNAAAVKTKATAPAVAARAGPIIFNVAGNAAGCFGCRGVGSGSQNDVFGSVQLLIYQCGTNADNRFGHVRKATGRMVIMFVESFSGSSVMIVKQLYNGAFFVALCVFISIFKTYVI